MAQIRRWPPWSCAVSLLLSAVTAQAAEPADLVLRHGEIYRISTNAPAWATAVAIRGGKFVAVGKDDDMAPSHELPPLWLRNGSVYVSRRAVIAAGRILGHDVRGVEMPPERSLDIDTPTDLAFAEFLIARNPHLQ